jgi:hypothetical protein
MKLLAFLAGLLGALVAGAACAGGIPTALIPVVSSSPLLPVPCPDKTNWFVPTVRVDGDTYVQANMNATRGCQAYVLRRSADGKTIQMTTRSGDIGPAGDNPATVSRNEIVSLTPQPFDTPVWMRLRFVVPKGPPLGASFNAIFQHKNTADVSDTLGPSPFQINVFEGGSSRIEIGGRTTSQNPTVDDPGYVIFGSTASFVRGREYTILCKSIWNYTSGGEHTCWVDEGQGAGLTQLFSYTGATGYNDAQGPRCQGGWYHDPLPYETQVIFKEWRCGLTDLSGEATAPPNPVAIFGSNLVFWYRADALSQTSNVVTSWPDQSGNGYTLTPTGSPAYEAAGLNGLPSVTFDAVDDYFITGNKAIATGGTAAMGFWAVCQMSSGADSFGRLISVVASNASKVDTTDPNGAAVMARSSTSDIFRTFQLAGAGGNIDITTGTNYRLLTTLDATNIVSYKNNVQQNSNAVAGPTRWGVSGTDLATMVIGTTAQTDASGNGSALNGSNFGGKCSEFIGVKVAPNSTQRAQIDTWLRYHNGF